MKRKITYLLLFFCFPLNMWAEYASNIRVQQKDKDIVVTYDLSHSSYVRLLVSVNGGSYMPLKAVEGAVGEHVRPGKNLNITWHPLEEKDAFVAHNVRFKIETTSTYSRYAMPVYEGGKTTIKTAVLGQYGIGIHPRGDIYGIKVMQTYNRGVGWYADFMSNFNFSTPEYEYVSSQSEPYYSGIRQSSFWALHAGFALDILEAAHAVNNRFNTFGFYMGLGAGGQKEYWETTDGKWIYNDTYSKQGGIGFNAGLLFSVYGFTVNGGTGFMFINGNVSMHVEIGAGWMF